MINDPHTGRVNWIDAAKGTGIILVVIGHTLRGLESANILSFVGDFGRVDAAIYAFHMPLMFMLSGLFIHKALPQGWLDYTMKHAQRLIWPLFLWTYIFFISKILAGGAANTPISWQKFPIFPLPPQVHFWFLWALFLEFLFIKLIYTLCCAIQVKAISWPAVTFVVLLLVLIWLSYGLYSPWTQQALVYLPLTLAGMSVRSFLFTKPLYVLFGSVVLAYFTVLTPLSNTGSVYNYGIAASVSTAIISVLSLLSRRISYAWLMVVGQASMAIFLSHTIASALVRAVLISMGMRDVVVHIVLGVASGIILPLIAFISIKKNKRALKIAGW